MAAHRARRPALVQDQEPCYMCARAGTTREHAPPISFFPRDRRVNVITVPSCPTHNYDNHHDVEYVRNLLASDFHVNAIGLAMFETARRSFERNPRLFRETFPRFRFVRVNGEQTLVYQINLTRFNRIMRGIAYALYFNDFGERFRHHWWIYNATMLSQREGFQDLQDQNNRRMRNMFRRVAVANRDTNQPEVFRYGLNRGGGHEAIYRLVFFGGVEVYAMGALTPRPPEE